MMEEIASAEPKSKIMIHNSTGAGKTIAVLSATLAKKAPHQKIVVFCRTISQLSSFLREWRAIYHKKKNPPLIVPFLGKYKMCRILANTSQKSMHIAPEAVGFLCHLLPCNFHPSRTIEKPQGERYLHTINLKLLKDPNTEYFKHQVFNSKKNQCPYYIQHSMLKAADIVLTTYPYILEPLFSYLLNSMNLSLDDTIIIVDEAHNLANTVRESLTLNDIEFIEEFIGNHVLLNTLKKIIGHIDLLSTDEVAPEYVWDELSSMLDVDDRFTDPETFTYLSSEPVLQFNRFLKMRNTGYLISNRSEIAFVRVSPAKWLKNLDDAALQIFMSGTLRPLKTFQKIFGFRKARLLDLEEIDNTQMFKGFVVNSGLTSKYERRNPYLYTTMSRAILRLAEVSPRHIMVVCPSYSFQEDLFVYLNKISKIPIVKEDRSTQISEIQNSLRFRKKKHLILAISSGKLSEGIQLVQHGNSLISTLIFAGLPFATPSPDQKFISQLLLNVLENHMLATNFEQVIPLFQLISQAIGRTVRSSVDKGALVILDFRAELLRGFDKSFEIKKFTNFERLIGEIDNFFSGYDTLEELNS